jgi:hypothetical protein
VTTQETMKAAVIDGANWGRIHKAVGAEEVNHAGFIGVIQHRIGADLPFFERPMTTIHPEFHRKGCPLYDDIRHAGFQTIPVTSCDKADDAVVQEALNRLSCHFEVRELVLVSCDRDIIEELLWLAELREQRGNPLRVSVMATCFSGVGGRCMTCEEILRKVEANPHAQFYEAARYRDLFKLN